VLLHQPVIARIVEQPVHETSISDIIIGSLGLVGVLLVSAALLGLVLGGILIGVKLLRARFGAESPADHAELRVTPTSPL
jgi:hypothetical protein